MKDEFSAELKGGAEIERRLKLLGGEMAQKCVAPAIRKGAEILRDHARNMIKTAKRTRGDKSDLPFSLTHTLRHSFRVEVRKKATGVYGDVYNDAPHAWIVEHGHKNVKGKRPGGKYERKERKGQTILESETPPYPFMRRAVEAVGNMAGDVVSDLIVKRLDKLDEQKAKG